MKKRRVIILGALGRDYHNFLTCYKDNPNEEVIAFTTAQVIETHRHFPKELAGPNYKKDIPIHPESELPRLIRDLNINEVVLSYSDLSHQEVMEKASIALASGASFRLLSPQETMLKAKKPVIAVCAVRTGAGKSQTSRAIGKILRKYGKKVSAVRHAMPYGNLLVQEVQKFASEYSLRKEKCTIEEREEYEPWIKLGFPVYAGVNYQKVLALAEKNVNVIIWDGGNNDTSFFKPDLNIVVADALRPSHEVTYYPGFVNILMADVILINKVNAAPHLDVNTIKNNITRYNPGAQVILAKSVITIDHPEYIKKKRVLVVGDGPSLTHGGLPHGAGYYIAKKYGCAIVNARSYAVGSIKETYKRYAHLGKELPAMGYSRKQLSELQQTINRARADAVIDGSPANLSKVLRINKPVANVSYDLDRKSVEALEKVLKKRGFC